MPVPAPAPVTAPARTTAAPPSPAPAPTRAAVTAVPAAAPGPAASTASDPDLVGLWASLVDAVGRASAFTRTYFIEAHPISLAKGVFVIGFDPEFAEHIDLVNNAKTHTLLQTKLQELGHPGVQIKFIKAERPAGWALPARATPGSCSAATAAATRISAASAPAASAGVASRRGMGRLPRARLDDPSDRPPSGG